MKKIMFLFAIAVSVMFVSCGGSASVDPATTDSTSTDTTVVVDSVVVADSTK